MTALDAYLDISLPYLPEMVVSTFNNGGFSHEDHLLFTHRLAVFPELSTLEREFLAYLLVSLKVYHPYSFAHGFRVAKLAQLMYNHTEDAFNEKGLHVLELAALFHDIGKLQVPLNILDKPGELTVAEYSLAQTHVDTTFYLLRVLESEFMLEVTKTARFHHERSNGQGYPYGLVGKDIPWLSQILGVCDTVDSMTSNRPYAMNMTIKDVKETFAKEIIGMKQYFDTKVYKLFFGIRVELIQRNLVNIIENVPAEILLKEL